MSRLQNIENTVDSQQSPVAIPMPDADALYALPNALQPKTALQTINFFYVTSAIVVGMLAAVYGFFAMLRAKELTDNELWLRVAQTWFFTSAFNFNWSPNIEFFKNHLNLWKTVKDGSKGLSYRLCIIPSLLWAILATLPGTAASVDSLSGISDNKLFVGIGTAIFSAAFFITRVNGAHGFLWNELYFKTALYYKLCQSEFEPFNQLLNDLKIAQNRLDRKQTFADVDAVYQTLISKKLLSTRTHSEAALYVFEEWLMGKLIPAVGGIGGFPVFEMMANNGMKASEHVGFLHWISAIAHQSVYDISASASSVFYYRTATGFYNTMKKVLSEFLEIMSESGKLGKVFYPLAALLLLSQAYTSGGGLADERLKTEFPIWLKWFNSWVVMAEAGVLVNGKAYGDFFLKIRDRMKNSNMTLAEALANYFSDAYSNKVVKPSDNLTIEAMIKKYEEAIVLHGVEENNDLKLKADGSSILSANLISIARAGWINKLETAEHALGLLQCQGSATSLSSL